MLAVDKIVDDRVLELLDLEPEESAEVAGLCYVRADDLAISRQKVGRGFSYFDAKGDRIVDEAEIQRLKSLTVPPALTDVWLCHLPHGHLQATGRDAKERKQYFYHPDWRKVRSQHKFNRMLLFGSLLPQIRATTDRHLRQRKVSREKVLAVVVKLLENTLIRIGNDRYVKKTRSYGLTTLRDRHVDVEGDRIQFEFRGKSGVDHEIELCDRRLATAIKRCQEIPGYEIFKYFDEKGNKQDVKSEDVNQYLQEITGQEITAKDFRTWFGTLTAAVELAELGKFTTETEAKQNITKAIKDTAKQLGNRPATCRKYYVHPAILDSYRNGSLLQLMAESATVESLPNRLNPEEAVILQLMKQTLPRRK